MKKETASVASSKPKLHRGWNTVVKILVLLGISYAIYRQLWGRENLQEIWGLFVEQLREASFGYLIPAVLLMPVNWLVESLKWQTLMQRVEVISLSRAYRAILAGVSLSIFTPNRIGEYGGRVLFVRPANNWRAVVATLVGSFGQLTALLSGGVVGILYYSYHHLAVPVDTWMLWATGFVGAIALALLHLTYLNVRWLLPVLRRVPLLRRWKSLYNALRLLRRYERRELRVALAWSFLRYGIYTFQYWLFLRFFGIEVSLVSGLAGVATIFLLQTSVPLPPVFGLAIRGGLALHIWSVFPSNEIGILAATFGLWILNLILPALVGMVFILNTNILRSLGYDRADHKD